MWASEIDFNDRDGFADFVSEDGALTLSWTGPEGQAVELEQSREARFSEPVLRYRGLDSGSVLTGLAEGEHFFRIRTTEGTWSEPLEITVTFFPELPLYWLLGLGGVVVVSTAVTILFGYRKTSRREGAE